MPHFIPSGTPSFLSPDFIHFPSGTPAVPLQPQYPSSDGGSSTPSTPASLRSASSNSSGREKAKARKYNHDPKYPDGALHWHSRHNGKCPECGKPGSLTKPKWSSKTKMLFIRCKDAACKYYRHTDYYSDPPASVPSNPPPAAAVPSGITVPCLAEPCSTGNKRNRSIACSNKMCLQDCVQHGHAECLVHRRAKEASLSGTGVGRPPSVLFKGPSLPSMPSIPPPSSQSSLPSSTLSYTPSFLDAAPPPSSPNPANPRSLLDITTSTVKPSRDNPLPRPVASPLQEGPTFQEVRHYARVLPQDWAEVIAAQQAAKAQQMLYEAQFRSSTKEGLGITVVVWRARLGVAPYLFERVVHFGREYCLCEDVDLCKAIGFDTATVFILNYLGGMWSHRSPRERHAVKPGSFLFFREAGPQVIAYEDPLLRFDELLALATDPGFGGASSFLTTTPTAAPTPTGPRPRPRPLNKPLGLPSLPPSALQYDWIAARSAVASSTEPPSAPAASPAPAPTASSSAATDSSSSSGSNDSEPKRNWPDDYTVKEIHNGFVILANKGRARKGSGIKVWDRFLEAFPGTERWISRRYYEVKATWETYTVKGNAAQKSAFNAWLETDASWTSIFGADVSTPPPKKRKVEGQLVDSDSD